MYLHELSTDGMQFETLKDAHKIDEIEEGVQDKEDEVSDSPLVEHIPKGKFTFKIKVAKESRVINDSQKPKEKIDLGNHGNLLLCKIIYLQESTI